MSGEKDLSRLLATMQPTLLLAEFVFCSLPNADHGDLNDLQPLASFREDEGLSLILEKAKADAAGLSYQGVFKAITLTVHSSLDAVGLTAAVATCLAAQGISANVVAAYYHDHVFIPEADAAKALELLSQLQASEV